MENGSACASYHIIILTMAPLPTSLPLSLSLFLCAAGTIERVSASNKGEWEHNNRRRRTTTTVESQHYTHLVYIFHEFSFRFKCAAARSLWALTKLLGREWKSAEQKAQKQRENLRSSIWIWIYEKPSFFFFHLHLKNHLERCLTVPPVLGSVFPLYFLVNICSEKKKEIKARYGRRDTASSSE